MTTTVHVDTTAARATAEAASRDLQVGGWLLVLAIVLLSVLLMSVVLTRHPSQRGRDFARRFGR